MINVLQIMIEHGRGTAINNACNTSFTDGRERRKDNSVSLGQVQEHQVQSSQVHQNQVVRFSNVIIAQNVIICLPRTSTDMIVWTDNARGICILHSTHKSQKRRHTNTPPLPPSLRFNPNSPQHQNLVHSHLLHHKSIIITTTSNIPTSSTVPNHTTLRPTPPRQVNFLPGQQVHLPLHVYLPAVAYVTVTRGVHVRRLSITFTLDYGTSRYT